MFGLSPLITLAIYGVAAAIALGVAYTAWSGFKSAIAAPYVAEAVAKQVKADKVEIDEAKAEVRAARQDADTAQGNETSCKATLAKQEGAAKRWQDKAADNLKIAQAAKEANERESRQLGPYIAELKTRAAAAPKLEECSIELGKARAVLCTDLARRRGMTCPK